MDWILELLASVFGEGLVGTIFGVIGLIVSVQVFYLLWLLAGTPGTVSWLLAPFVFVVPWLLWCLWRRRARTRSSSEG